MRIESSASSISLHCGIGADRNGQLHPSPLGNTGRSPATLVGHQGTGISVRSAALEYPSPWSGAHSTRSRAHQPAHEVACLQPDDCSRASHRGNVGARASLEGHEVGMRALAGTSRDSGHEQLDGRQEMALDLRLTVVKAGQKTLEERRARRDSNPQPSDPQAGRGPSSPITFAGG